MKEKQKKKKTKLYKRIRSLIAKHVHVQVYVVVVSRLYGYLIFLQD